MHDENADIRPRNLHLNSSPVVDDYVQCLRAVSLSYISHMSPAELEVVVL